MDKVQGSMGTLSAMQLTAAMEGLDAQSKTILSRREVLAVILQGAVKEYQSYRLEEIMDFIEADPLTGMVEVSPGRTNTEIRRDSTEYVFLNEKAASFDIAFRARNPLLSGEDVQVNLYIDVESQKTYRPGYPIEKRGMYYLARRLSSQLSLALNRTDYGRLEKCYSIWICREDIPEKARYSISVYETVNTKNTGGTITARENYDLMTLVVIKLGDSVYNGVKGQEGYGLLRFLNAVMYPHRDDFMDTVSEYIDFTNREDLKKEMAGMSGFWGSILETEVKKAAEKAEKEAAEKAEKEAAEKSIQIFVLDNLEEQVPEERIVAKLQRRFELSEESAVSYFKRFAEKE